MNEQRVALKEETLDPADWDKFRELGHRMVDDMIDYLRTVRDRPVWQPIPEEVAASFREPLPDSPESIEQVYEDFRERILPYPTGNIHPRFWGWVMGNGTATAMMAEMLAAGMNLNQGGGAQSGGLVERQVVDWCKEMLGFPREASGILVSGGSMANLTGLTVARNSQAGFNIRKEGLCGSKLLRVYASTEVHSSVTKAVELLGLGQKGLCLIPVGEDFTIDIPALRTAIQEDRARGVRPLCVVGCAGTVNTGAIDPLDTLADICSEEKIWFHVDGAFGALAFLAPELRSLLKGMERADSLAFDMHKWMYLSYEVGCTLVRDPEAHRLAFTLTPDYLEHTTRGIAGSDLWFSDYGVQLTRGFRALKVWMSLKEHGIDTFGRLILQNVEQARYCEWLVKEEKDLELIVPASLNIVCFRYKGLLTDPAALDALNKELLLRLHESGVAAPSYTVVNGKYALRTCITNHRSKREDFELFVKEVLRIGRELEKESLR
ncbi:aminotransferase class I/II-fold pyridoxal phosphate-dependent enzyme [bacterium]|nr:MAG: aminotransferase class I/II-fold pyridoxal phosphate-dependent enzyme [bacterium]